MAYRHQAPFDASRDFVALTFFKAAGAAVERNQPFDKATVDSRVLRKLYESHKIGYADASAAEDAGALAPATLDDLGDGKFAVGAPWLDKPEEIEGRDKAVWRAQQIRDAGEPDDHHGVALAGGDGGWWVIKAEWAGEPEKVQGREAAKARADALRSEGPPSGWTPPNQLVGSDAFEASYEIAGETVQLGDLVASAQTASGHPPEVWNKLEPEQRDALIKAELDRRNAGKPATEPEAATPAAAGPTEPPPSHATEPAKPTRDERIAALVDANTEDQLRALADGLDGLAGAKNKAAVAGLIVDADRDAKPEPGADAGGAA